MACRRDIEFRLAGATRGPGPFSIKAPGIWNPPSGPAASPRATPGLCQGLQPTLLLEFHSVSLGLIPGQPGQPVAPAPSLPRSLPVAPPLPTPTLCPVREPVRAPLWSRGTMLPGTAGTSFSHLTVYQTATCLPSEKEKPPPRSERNASWSVPAQQLCDPRQVAAPVCLFLGPVTVMPA